MASLIASPSASRILVLGGTTEAGRLAAALAARREMAAILSLAGRTAEAAPSALPRRIGGFGGIEGLMRWLAAERITAVVDATHPFAARISVNAAAACAALGLPLARLTRPAWTPQPGDRWQEVADARAAALALGAAPRRVFLTVGRLTLDAFTVAPQHRYLVRTIDAPDPPPALPDLTLVTARPPFTAEAETALMREHAVEVLVTKNSGGAATAGKLAAARALGLPVVVIRRPEKPAADTFLTVEAVLAWLEAHRPPP
ncbi:cobalt-precorrin-6A reductase [Chelatococcus sp. SYSU_G07232]|uniref:Cobalt-precorrin-6A reductase n=1 Tax=Chelatococcus albus TaxID=3047466 RepID=A0ABT7AHK1_9HYPH|nr:cobalt-precorrin-6A reductase [Chelatococcus sp. SYSU_G07232]MDJ1158839.1 cobalt-precorrin-6A reductase [Chelatococcus sp. SYSU_G07232]